MRPPRALRTRLLLAVVAAVGVTIAVLTAAFNVVVARSLANDADQIVRGRAESERAALIVGDGRIFAPDTVEGAGLETRAWVFQGTRPLRAPQAPAALHAAARALAGGPERTVEAPGDSRLYALPVTDGGRRLGTVVAGISMAPYDRTRTIALIGSISLALVALAAVAAGSAMILRAALRPVARMTEDAATWSEAGVGGRLASGPPHDEITRLATTLDALLDRLAAGLRRERRLTAEVSHELRTPLAQIRAEADLALRRQREPASYRAALEEIRSAAARLEDTMATLLATARQEAAVPRGTADAAEAVGRVAAALAPLARAAGVSVDLDGLAPGARAGVEGQVIERILHPVVENACRHARARVRLSVSEGDGVVVVGVADDGPGVAEDERERIFEPGARGSTAAGAPGGAGLGLALARRLARAAGGDVEAEAGPGGRFTIRLPAA